MVAIFRIIPTILVSLAFALGIASHGTAQQHTNSVMQQLVGAWLLASYVDTRPDGTQFEAFGGNTKGLLTGHFSVQVMGDARRKFASNNRGAFARPRAK